MPVVDTSWLYALLDELDAHHTQALAQAKTTDRLLVPGPVLAELLQLIHFRVRRDAGDAAAHRAARQALLDLEATTTVAFLDRHDLHAAADLYRTHPRLSYVDAVVIAAGIAAGEGLLTFDDRQRKAARRTN